VTITPPLVPGDESFNCLADRLAASLSTAFGYSLEEAEGHIRDYYLEYEQSLPARRDAFKKAGVAKAFDWTAADLFRHDDIALVLFIGYRLAGGDPHSVEFLDWRKTCWDALKAGQRVPSPRTAR
jgi:hypothetical protein